MEVLGLALLLSVPALGLLVLWLAMDRWGRKHDPMRRTRFDFLTPGAATRRREPGD